MMIGASERLLEVGLRIARRDNAPFKGTIQLNSNALIFLYGIH